MLMGAEMPAFTAFVGNMLDPRIHLAAWGSLVFPLSLVIEGPIIQMLAASTALAEDGDSWRKLRRWMFQLAGVLTALHALIAFTPLFDFIARGILGVPENVIEPGRIGFQIMLPWTISIAWRRFNQGVLIRTERARMVTIGTAIRLGVLLLTLNFLPDVVQLPGVMVGAIAVTLAVFSEAIFSEWAARSAVQERILTALPAKKKLTAANFRAFYIPLALTPLITLFIQPVGSAAMSRMPEALDSLACWSPVHGLIFLVRATGFAFQEVVVALSPMLNARKALTQFAKRLGLACVATLSLIAFTPLGTYWFGTVSGLPKNMVALSVTAVGLAVLMPGYAVAQSLYQGQLVHARQTKPITQSVLIYATIATVGLLLGATIDTTPGIIWAIATFTIAGILQTLFLRYHARRLLSSS